MPPMNAHPVVMFEIMAKDQARLMKFYATVFGWDYDEGSNDFLFVRFPDQSLATLGGIGKAQEGVPGFEAGHAFYLSVTDIDATLAVVAGAGGATLVERTEVDDFTFGMFTDPEGNAVGLLEQEPQT